MLAHALGKMVLTFFKDNFQQYLQCLKPIIRIKTLLDRNQLDPNKPILTIKPKTKSELVYLGLAVIFKLLQYACLVVFVDKARIFSFTISIQN